MQAEKLKEIMAAKNYTQRQLSFELGITERTFNRKLNHGVFGTDEATKISKILDIKDPADIFLR